MTRTDPARTSTKTARRGARRLPWIGTALCGALLLSGCGADVQKQETDAQNVSIRNCGVDSTYPRPSRPVAYDVSAIEKMFSLGLAEKMRGIVMPKTVTSVIDKSPYREDYEKVETVSDGVLSQEALVNAKADWAFAGWQAGFSEERGVTPDSLKNLGINSFMQNETCFNYKGHQQDADPVQSMHQDLKDLGNVFGVSDRADKLVEDLKKRQKALEDADRPKQAAKVFVYDSGTSEPYTAGKRTTLNSVISMAGGSSVTQDLDARWATVGWEPVVQKNPDVIVVVDYNKQPVAEKIDYLRTQSPLKNSPAVKNDRIFVLDYAEAVSSPRNIDAAEHFAAYLREKGL